MLGQENNPTKNLQFVLRTKYPVLPINHFSRFCFHVNAAEKAKVMYVGVCGREKEQEGELLKATQIMLLRVLSFILVLYYF